jgi:hypothetical protein
MPYQVKLRNKKPDQIDRVNAVRKKGLEPPRREAPDPKSGAATNYATSAVRIFKSGKDRLN